MSNLKASLLDHDIDNLYRHSRFLRKIAWIVELIVVFIGLCISIALVIGDGGGSLVGNLILSAPFVMISLVELTKIPFVVGLWNSKKSFVMYLAIIVFLCLITFETLLNGFERAFSSINKQIDLNEIEISKIENQIKVNEENILLALEGYQVTTSKINSNKEAVNKQYQQQYSSAVKRNARLSKNVPELRKTLNAAKNELIQLKIEKSELLKELSEKKEERFKTVLTRSQDSVNVAQQERDRLLAQIETLKEEKATALKDSNFFTSGSIKREYDGKIRYVEEQLGNINDKTITGEEKKIDVESVGFLDNYYADLLALKESMIKQKNEDVAYINSQYTKALSASKRNLINQQNRLAKQKNNALKNLEQKLESVDNEFSDKKEYINELKKQNNQYRFDIRVIETETNSLALSNQIYRIASYIDNVSNYKEIKKDTITLVGLLWFGSLALIGSITGIALTLSGLHLGRLASQKEEEREALLLEVSEL